MFEKTKHAKLAATRLRRLLARGDVELVGLVISTDEVDALEVGETVHHLGGKVIHEADGRVWVAIPDVYKETG